MLHPRLSDPQRRARHWSEGKMTLDNFLLKGGLKKGEKRPQHKIPKSHRGDDEKESETTPPLKGIDNPQSSPP